MVEKHRNMSLGILLNMVIGGVFLIAAGITVVAVNQGMRRQALVEAESKARIILDRNFAVHTYFSEVMKPSIFKWAKPILTKEHFDPTWMSSTYAVREIGKFFKSLSPADYYFRDAAINARSPGNEADDFERTFLKQINADKSREAESAIRTIDGKPYFVVLRRAEVMEKSCLRCHGDPKDAPTGMLDIYGPERSFHRKLGETISAVSLRIPLSEAYQAADAFSWRLSGVLFLVLTTLFLAQYALYRWFLMNPLSLLQEKSRLIASSPAHLGEQIPTPFGKELNELAVAFNAMSATLRHDRDHLDDLVQQRTADCHLAGEQFRQERDFADSLLQTAQTIVLLLDPEGRIVRVNRYFEELTGYQMAELKGRDWFSTFIPEAHRERIRDIFLKAVSNTRKKGNINTILTKDGRLREIEWYDTTIKDAQGRIMGLLSTGQDITERKRAEEEKRKMESENRQLQKAESLGRMAGAIAHHFNNQLQAVMGNLQLAMSDLPKSASSIESMTEAMKAARKAARLSGQMLTYLGQTAGYRETLDLSETCRQTLPMLKAALPKDVILNTDLPSPGPAIQGNANEIQQILTNMVANAQEAMVDSGGAIHVTVKLVPGADIRGSQRFPVGWAPKDPAYACLEVKDDGPGISEQDMEKLFDPFFSTKFTGRGLGLAVALGIVKAHGGCITVESRGGTRKSEVRSQKSADGAQRTEDGGRVNAEPGTGNIEPSGSVFRVFLPVVEGETSKSEKKVAAGHAP